MPRNSWLLSRRNRSGASRAPARRHEGAVANVTALICLTSTPVGAAAARCHPHRNDGAPVTLSRSRTIVRAPSAERSAVAAPDRRTGTPVRFRRSKRMYDVDAPIVRLKRPAGHCSGSRSRPNVSVERNQDGRRNDAIDECRLQDVSDHTDRARNDDRNNGSMPSTYSEISDIQTSTNERAMCRMYNNVEHAPRGQSPRRCASSPPRTRPFAAICRWIMRCCHALHFVRRPCSTTAPTCRARSDSVMRGLDARPNSHGTAAA